MDITELLDFSVKQNASDLHLSAGVPPMVRVDGDVRKLTLPDFTHAEVHRLVTDIMNDAQRSEFEEKVRPLDKSRWAGAVDTVGGDILAKVLSQMNYDGRVATVGLAASFSLNTTVMPFILRGVDLLGVDSVMIPYERRVQAWARLAKELPQEIMDQVSEEVGLEALPAYAQNMVEGKIKGRVLVNPNI